jgi:23S rRNA (guanine745-N1)-methyltransferase
MVRARQEFLAGGHFAPISAALVAAAMAAAAAAADEAASAGPDRARHVARPANEETGRSDRPCVVDVGAGTAFYLAAVLSSLPGYAGLALDASKHALRVAARAHPRIGAVGCDAWHRLPVADGAAALVLDVFAPRDGAELRRILRPDGHLLVVTPQADHLAELTGPLQLLRVDDRKSQRLAGTLGSSFTLVSEQDVRAPSRRWPRWARPPGMPSRARSRVGSRRCQIRSR